MAYTKYSLTPANNNAAPPDGAPEGMLPSAVNDTMRDMMAQIRDCGDGIRDGTYTMTAPKITGGSITGVTFSSSNATITGGSVTGVTFSSSAATITGGSVTGVTFSSSAATITGGSVTGITDLAVADGGTGASSFTANNVLLGNGTSAFQTVAPSTAGNVLTSDGTTWTSSANTQSVKAWVNFDGTGTPAIYGSFNVSSITDNGTGDYTINFTTAMPDANYSIGGSTGYTSNGSGGGFLAPNRIGSSGNEAAPTASACRVTSQLHDGSAIDVKYISVQIFR